MNIPIYTVSTGVAGLSLYDGGRRVAADTTTGTYYILYARSDGSMKIGASTSLETWTESAVPLPTGKSWVTWGNGSLAVDTGGARHVLLFYRDVRDLYHNVANGGWSVNYVTTTSSDSYWTDACADTFGKVHALHLNGTSTLYYHRFQGTSLEASEQVVSLSSTAQMQAAHIAVTPEGEPHIVTNVFWPTEYKCELRHYCKVSGAWTLNAMVFSGWGDGSVYGFDYQYGLAADSKGTLHAASFVYEDSSAVRKVKYFKYTAGTWKTENVATQVSETDPTEWIHLDIGVTPSNVPVIVWNSPGFSTEYPLVNVFYTYKQGSWAKPTCVSQTNDVNIGHWDVHIARNAPLCAWVWDGVDGRSVVAAMLPVQPSLRYAFWW